MDNIVIDTLKKYAWKEPYIISQAISDYKKLEHLEQELNLLKKYTELSRMEYKRFNWRSFSYDIYYKHPEFEILRRRIESALKWGE